MSMLLERLNEAPTRAVMRSTLAEQFDGIQLGMDLFDNPISRRVWALKYKRRTEADMYETIDRVAKAIHPEDEHESDLAYMLMEFGLFLPAGRILAGAGLPEHASTLMNCYVMGALHDSLGGILQNLTESAQTQKYGGGIGVDFTPLRPKGAEVSTAAYFAGGPVAFMGLWDAMGHALEAGGNRRGGKMATLHCTHPDVIEFIEAKTAQGKLTSFNISVTVSDAFMKAVENDDEWILYHDKPRIGERDTQEILSIEGRTVFVWKVLRARELWDKITATTYEYSEPGVIFIDRMNDLNPLSYAEDIHCTNPCGEQPLPHYGACNLGSINLARMVSDAFTENAKFNYDLLEVAVRAGVRFLDKVLDVTKYPVHAMYMEAVQKRRIGLGITGLGDTLAMLGAPYGSDSGRDLVEQIMRAFIDTAYDESVNLARDSAPFPAYDANEHIKGKFIYESISVNVFDKLRDYGIRNGVVTSVAPTGTISVVFGDVSSGCEPIFSHKTERKVKVKDEENNDTWEVSYTYSYSARVYAAVHDLTEDEAADYLASNKKYATAEDIDPSGHILMQGVVQKYIDSSISKTVNIPEDMPFEGFKLVYDLAYKSGAKGCTTYRKSEARGSVLVAVKTPTDGGKEVDADTVNAPVLSEETRVVPSFRRGEVLFGATYKVPWPGLASPIFVTINNTADGHPVEVFISSKNDQFNEWSVAMSVMISKLLQKGTPATEVGQDLKEITLSSSTAWHNGKHYGSIIARIGELIANHKPNPAALLNVDYSSIEQRVLAHYMGAPEAPEYQHHGTITGRLTSDVERLRCSFCNSLNTRMEEGCVKCSDCGQSKCG